MLDVMSMSQFLIHDRRSFWTRSARPEPLAGYDWMNYLITRFEPSDGPQNQMVAFLRSIFGLARPDSSDAEEHRNL